MSCIQDKIVEDLISKISHPQLDRFTINKNTIFIPDSVKSANGSTFGVVTYIEKQLNERYTELYGTLANNKLGDLISLEPLNDGIKIHINPSRSVEKAIEYKREEATREELKEIVAQELAENQQQDFEVRDRQGNQFFDQEGNVYATAEDIIAAQELEDVAFDSFNPQTTNSNQVIMQPNYEDYILRKQELIKKLGKSIEKLYNEKRNTNPPNISKRINRLTKIKEDLELDIAKFTNNIDKLQVISSFFQKDFDLIQELLQEPTLDNIFLAKDLFNYIKNSADIRIENVTNKLFNPTVNTTYDAGVLGLLGDLHNRINFQEREIEEAVDKIFLQLLEKNQEKLEQLYPNKTLEQIKDTLLQNLQDVSWAESMFFGQGENVLSENNIIESLIRVEYEKEVLRQESKSSKVIGKINASLPAVEKELARLGRKLTSKLSGIVYTGYNYRFLYQTDSNGEYKSSLIGKYSIGWNNWIKTVNRNHNNAIFEARQNRNWAEVEKLLNSRFNDLNDKTEFVKFDMLHDIFNDSSYDQFKKGTDSEAEAYKNYIQSKIGLEEYNNLIEEQRNLLDSYLDEVELITQNKLLQQNVDNVSKLSAEERQQLETSIARLNPTQFLDSFLAGRKGMIEYTIGTQTNEKPSYLKYNSVIPKAINSADVDTNFYDSRFSFIENNDILYPFWQAMREGTQLINENLVDSNISINKNSLLLFKKTFAEETVNKDVKDIVKQGLSNMLNFKQFIKDIASAKLPDYTAKDDVILPTEVKSFNSAAHNEFQLIKTDLANILDTHLTDDSIIAWNNISLDQQKAIGEVLGLNDAQQLLNITKTAKIKVGTLKMFAERKIMEQQTMNTPLMIKALLEFSAEHKARTTAVNEVNIYREKSRSILNKDNTMFSKKDTARKSDLERQDFFYKTVILNQREKDHSGSITKVLAKYADEGEWKLLGKFFIKNFSKEEKDIYESAVKRLDKIEEDLPNASDALSKILRKEQAELEARIRILGKDYLGSAIWDNAINKLSVQVGLGYNILANIKNRLQGLTSVISRDGEFWGKGNIYPVNHFMGLNKTRFVNPSYKKEWDKAVLFIRQLNLIQDGTNEIQRAENKVKSKARFLNPMYGTEVVEWYNQSSGILAMAMDVEVRNGDNAVPLFDGSTFPAFNIVDGILQLKPEFRTEENIEHFEKISSQEMINWKMNVEDMTRSLNGDYSKTGVTRIKGSIYTTPIMMFKTWIPKYISSRYKINQKNINTGNVETGYLVSTFLNKKTSFSGGLMLGVTGLLGIASSSPALFALPVFAGIIGWGLAKNHLSKKRQLNSPIIDDTEPIALAQQAAYVLKMIAPHQLLATPINSIVGKEVLKDVAFKPEYNLTPQEQRDVRLMARNMQNTILLILMKLAVQAFFRFNDDDEPKGEEGSEQKKRYIAQQKAKEEYKARNNFLENTLTGLYQETALAVEPTSLATTMGSKNGLQGPIDKVLKVSTALIRSAHGEDEILKGDRAGQSKVGNAARKIFLPSLFRDLGHDTWRAGFETSMEKEWINNEGIDGIFDSDYKEDKKTAEKRRGASKLHFIEEYEDKNNVVVKDLPQDEQDKIEKKAKKAAKKEAPNPDRKDYNNEQELIPEAE